MLGRCRVAILERAVAVAVALAAADVYDVDFAETYYQDVHVDLHLRRYP